MTTLTEFASSSNGDRWFLGQQEGAQDQFVLHRGNAPSGGHETRTPLRAFLNMRPTGPEQAALLSMLGNDGKAAEASGTAAD